MNAIEKIQQALGVKKDAPEVMTVVLSINGIVELHGHGGRVLKLTGDWSVGTQLIVKDGTVQSVVQSSGLVVYEM